MRAVVLGCGRVGSRIANWLLKEGWEVAVIDADSEAFKRLGEDFTGMMVSGSGTDERSLREAGIERAEVFIAVTAKDNLNLMAGQIVQAKFKTRSVIVRVDDPIRAQAFQDLDLRTICPTNLTFGEIRNFLKKRRK
jgi:trk system potassium uptake protein TrkA